ncbi:MAG: hypothetical protein AAFP97_04865 [Pseudomonadota bacterium]
MAAATPKDASHQKRVQIAKAAIQSHASKLAQFENIADNIEVRGTGEQVYVSLSAEVPMMFAGVLGTNARRVSASSLAEESVTSSMSAISLSVILDLSSSMTGRFDSGSKSAAVRAALANVLKDLEGSMGGAAMAEMNLSSGLYGFNWGAVPGETVPLEPGVTGVTDALVNMTLGEGSVPSAAIEAALDDQVQDKKDVGQRDRFMIYITEGGIDDEKADQKGKYLSEAQQIDGTATHNVGQRSMMWIDLRQIWF